MSDNCDLQYALYERNRFLRAYEAVHRMRIFTLDHPCYTLEKAMLRYRLSETHTVEYLDVETMLNRLPEADVLILDENPSGMTAYDVVRRAYYRGWRGAVFISTYHFDEIGEPFDQPLSWVGLKLCDAKEISALFAPSRRQLTSELK